MTDRLVQYVEQLHALVDQLTAPLQARHAARLRCGRGCSLSSFRGEHFLRGIAIDRGVIFGADLVGRQQHLALIRRERTDARGGRLDQGALDD